ncbi:hypothetical protein IWX84_002660 [Flavobacterium sp. CG_9.10]|uniref:hypothetical protein n=1 Tax=Flavobacterium sp. CG_9.10 TaxID=2787729 RepID=UPI0018C9B185|nr:hypothetical protein [Flavobacterium sp. CG_9.10]MBG6111772.1 hypothetical protein [Flavobacterium sp. CG_9.10]
MKVKLFFLSLSMILCLISCKKEVKKEQKIDDTKNLFKVTLDLVIKKNDTLHLYYAQDSAEDYTEQSSIWLPVEGKEVRQQVTFNLPKDVLPIKVRFDFGVNRENKGIILNKVKFNYFDKQFIADETNIFNYFRADENATIIDYKTRSLKRKDPNSVKGASLYPHDLAIKTEIEKLIK